MDGKRGSCRRKSRVEKPKGKRNIVETGTVSIILNETNAVDRISKLPDDIIKHILSFLTPRELVTTRTLGKMWSRFSPGLYLKPKDLVKNNAVEIFESYKNKGERLKTLSLNIPDPFEYSTCINDWLQLVANNDIDVMEIHFGPSGSRFAFPTFISTPKSLVVLSLKNCLFRNLNLTTSLLSLQELTFDNVDLPYGFNSLISACYNIRTLRLKFCSRAEDLNLNGLDKLEKVEIWRGCCSIKRWGYACTWENILYSSSIKIFVIHECCSKSCNSGFSLCNNPDQTVRLRAKYLPDYFYMRLFSDKFSDSFPQLKRLFVHGRHQKDKEFRIERSTLEVLHLSYIDGLKSAIINTPGLHTFKFLGKTFEPFLSTMKIGTRLRKITLEFYEYYAVWFSNLRLFVRNLSQDGVLSLRFTNVVSFDWQEHWTNSVSHVCKLKHLKVKNLHSLSPSSCKDLISGILSGFRPETLTLRMTSEPRDLIEVIQKDLQNSKCPIKKCWRNGLKRFEIQLSSVVSKKRPSKYLVDLKIKFRW